MIKGLTGYKASKPHENHTHMLYTIGEHQKQLDTIHQLNREIETIKAEHEREINRIARNAEERIEKIKEITQEKINDISGRLDRARQQTKQVENINTNLIRIAKERANAKRGLKPKKEHTGYVLLSIDEASYSHKDDIKRHVIIENYPFWRIRLQTPYIATLDVNSVETLITTDLKNKLASIMTIKRSMDFHSLSNYDHSKMNELWKSNDNFIFKSILKVNAIKGFWEIEYWTRYIIKVTPEMLVNTD